MADRNRSPVDVHSGWIEAQLPEDHQGLHAESFIQFEKLDIAQRPACFRSDFTHGIDGRKTEPLRLAAARSLCANESHWLEIQFPCPFGAGNDEGRGSVAHARRITRGHGAALFESGLEAGENIDV